MFVATKTLKWLHQLASQANAYYTTERYYTSIECQTLAQLTQSMPIIWHSNVLKWSSKWGQDPIV